MYELNTHTAFSHALQTNEQEARDRNAALRERVRLARLHRRQQADEARARRRRKTAPFQPLRAADAAEPEAT